jgi:hypothetical protein
LKRFFLGYGGNMTKDEKLAHISNIINAQCSRIASYIARRKPMLDSGMLNLLKKTADDAEMIAEVIDFDE